MAERFVCGTLMHTPEPGSCEIIEDGLIETGVYGRITQVLRPSDEGYGALLAEARRSGALLKLGPQQYLLPGLIDLHIHAPQWPQLGKALHLPLEEWLNQCTFPLEAKYADAAFADRIYASLVDNLLASGTTSAVYFATIHMEATRLLARHCLEKGQRAFVGKVVMDDPAQCPEYYRDDDTATALDQTVAFIEDVRKLAGNKGGLVKPVVTPRFIPSCTDEALAGLGEIAREHDCHVQTHCSESDWEHGFVIDRHGKTDTESLDGFGLISRHTILAHSNFIGSSDMDLIARRRAGVAHCPLSNFYFSNAVFPLRAALSKGLHVGLGTDISGGPSASMFDACRQTVAASRALEDGVDPDKNAPLRGRTGARVNFMEAFWLATVGGGIALDEPVGKFAPGYSFDALLVDASISDTSLNVWDDVDSLEDVFQKIVYTSSRNNIRKVWVEGDLRVDKGEAA